MLWTSIRICKKTTCDCAILISQRSLSPRCSPDGESSLMGPACCVLILVSKIPHKICFFQGFGISLYCCRLLCAVQFSVSDPPITFIALLKSIDASSFYSAQLFPSLFHLRFVSTHLYYYYFLIKGSFPQKRALTNALPWLLWFLFGVAFLFFPIMLCRYIPSSHMYAGSWRLCHSR